MPADVTSFTISSPGTGRAEPRIEEGILRTASLFSSKQLYELQEIDLEAADREKALAEVRARLADDSAVSAARESGAALDSKLAQPTAARRQVEQNIEQQAEKLREAEARLYGGTVTNPRELEAYEAERKILAKQRSAEEDRLLELMVEVEEIQSARDEALLRLQRLEAEREEERPHLLEKDKSLVEDLDGLRRVRAEITLQLPDSVLAIYESLRRRHTGHAVAKVERSMCQGCRLLLPTMELQRARTSQGVVQCSSCRRILYVV